MDVETYAERHRQLPDEEIEPHLLEWLQHHSFRSLLDVGCGSGRLLHAMQARGLLEGVRVRGVDLSSTNLRRLRAQLPEVDAQVDDAETLATVPDGDVDLLISTQVIEHVDDGRMLRAIGRVLSEDGRAYVSTVFKRPWARFFWRTESGQWALDPTHLREYTSDRELLDLLPGAGLWLLDSCKVPVSFPPLDFVLRRLPVDAERVLATPTGELLRRVRVPIPGYFVWSLVLAPAGGDTRR